MKGFKLHGLMDKVSAKRSEVLADKKALWLEEQRHKWMCGDQPELPEDCPF
jgi:hypothetical protein